MGDFTQSEEWLLKNGAIFVLGWDILPNISIDRLQPTCMYELRVKKGPRDFSLGLAIVELV